jgi:cobalt-zinc-cadmium efflux system outer membrane protein
MFKNLTYKNLKVQGVYSLIFFMLLTGCARTLFNEKYVSDRIESRSGHSLSLAYSDTLQIPEGTTLDDGLTEEESVAIALWNNRRFQVDMADLGFARADLIEAGMLPNPVLSLLFPVGPKQLEFTFSYAIDVLWQRTKRVGAAKLNSEKVAESLVQNGLGLVRDVYVAFAELDRNMEKLPVLEEEADLYDEIATIASARFEMGDISKLEETAFRIAASEAREAAINAKRDMENQKILFLSLLGLISENSDISIDPSPVQMMEPAGTEQLISTALAFRPDIRAAELEIEMAAKRLGWERSKILNLTAMLDANAQGKEGFEMGPGGQMVIPLFDFNQGGRKRARTELQRASNHYIAVQQTVLGEVLAAYQNYTAAMAAYEMLSGEIIPKAEQAAEMGELSYLSGEISYLEFLVFKRQLLNAQLRFLESKAEVRKKGAELHYSLGGKVSSPDPI